MNTVERITSGLAKRAAVTAPKTFLAGSPATLSDLNQSAQAASSKAKRLRDLSRAVMTHVENETVRVARDWAERGYVTDEHGRQHDTLGKTRREKLMAGEVERSRKLVLKEHAEERSRLRAELGEINGAIAAVKQLWASPVAVLMRDTIGKKSGKLAEVANSGPYEIDVLLKHAVLKGDRELAAALFARIDSLPQEQRKSVSVSKSDVAAALVGEEYTKAAVAIATAEIAQLEGEVASAEAEGKSLSSHLKLELGVKRRELSSLVGVEHSEDDSDETREENVPDAEESSGDIHLRLDKRFPAVKGSGAEAIGG